MVESHRYLTQPLVMRVYLEEAQVLVVVGSCYERLRRLS